MRLQIRTRHVPCALLNLGQLFNRWELRCAPMGEGGVKQHTPRQIFDKFDSKNVMNCIRDPSWQFCPESLEPPGILAKFWVIPHLNFQPVCIYGWEMDRLVCSIWVQFDLKRKWLEPNLIWILSHLSCTYLVRIIEEWIKTPHRWDISLKVFRANLQKSKIWRVVYKWQTQKVIFDEVSIF